VAEVRWNHNVHYQRLVLKLVPDGARRALDVGCGEGLLTRDLARAGVPDVVGIDRDAGQLALARAAGGGPTYVHGDFLTHDLGAPFDLVATVATLHHVDLPAGLRRLRGLVRPGGRLVVVGLGRRSLPADLPWDAAGFFVHRFYRARHGYWQHTAPIVDPPLTTAETRRVAATELPGVRFRRLVLFRHLLVWDAP
jgi:2-polyprenyl-3-methyl-5-hydroxy-6-metoxy-1,4-benzoquinol methylase